MNDNYLKHYGVKGMRWGVRKDRNKKDKNKKDRNKKNTFKPKSRKISKTQYLKDIDRMPDTDLRNKINRLQMENQYAKLTNNDMARYEKVAKGALKTVLTVSTVLSTGLGIYSSSNKIQKLVNDEILKTKISKN